MNSQAQPWVEEQDAIQQLALEECVKRQRVEHDVRVLILPAGRCRLAGRFAQLGARVTVAEEPSQQQEIENRIAIYRRELGL